MDSFLRRLRELDDTQLLGISRAIDLELERRMQDDDETSESARQRALSRQRSYRRSTGSTAPPIRAVGLRRRDQHVAY
jgi:hypothetical protein